jgi:ketosteroid isomerase-like protein
VNRSNIEILRDMYDAFAREDAETALGALDPDIDWQPDPYWPDEEGPYHGHDGVNRYMDRIYESLDDYHAEPVEFIDAGPDQVIVIARERGRGKQSGAEIQTMLNTHIWTMRDGKAVRLQLIWDRTSEENLRRIREALDASRGATA